MLHNYLLMPNPPDCEWLASLPLVLAGPILQRVETETVTVWVALKQSCRVMLTIYSTADRGQTIGEPLFRSSHQTVALGQALHVVAVSAIAPAGRPLTSDALYAYDLSFHETYSLAVHTLPQGLVAADRPAINLSYFDHPLPTFALPPQDVADLRLVHGSCRKPGGEGFDALPVLDSLIADAADQPCHRPHQLLLTGDQIYADDVADPLLWVATRLGDALLGWEEQLPIGLDRLGQMIYQTPRSLPPGERSTVATDQAGLTAGLPRQPKKSNSHLFGLGEFYAAYLLGWSPACWPTLPPGRILYQEPKLIRQWDADVRKLRQFIHTLGKVQRSLANIPVYTVFDDHDVSDDWNLNRAWCLRVLGRPLGQRIVQNALLAYATFQAWGNTPEQFTAGQPGGALLAAAQDWAASAGSNVQAYGAVGRYVGMPATDAQTRQPKFVRCGQTLVLDRHPDALTWHYTIRSPCHEIILLDTRTWRGYPADQPPPAPPMLLCPEAYEQQLGQTLQPDSAASGDSILSPRLTFVVAPTNVFGLNVIDWVHEIQLRRRRVFASDVGDAWNIHSPALAQLLQYLFDRRQQVVVLSGDIHYSAAVRLTYQSGSSPPAVLVQLTASAFKNEETLTRLIHTRLKSWLLPERVRRWRGWRQPPDMVELPRKGDRATPPDWRCALEWIPRQPVCYPSFSKPNDWLPLPERRHELLRSRWYQPLLFWLSRWFQSGREVVGLNNIALVQFRAASRDRALSVIQDVYWFSPWRPIRLVYSRYEGEINPNPSQLEPLDKAKN